MTVLRVQKVIPPTGWKPRASPSEFLRFDIPREGLKAILQTAWNHRWVSSNNGKILAAFRRQIAL